MTEDNLFKEKKSINNKSIKTTQIDNINNKCANCSSPVSPTADICEKCHTWLLVEKCCFCYAKVEENQNFCTECGNAPTGIQCDKCGIISLFDFCSQCNIPLTAQAQESLEEVINLPEIQEIINIEETPNTHIDVNQKIQDDSIELNKLQEYLSTSHPISEYTNNWETNKFKNESKVKNINSKQHDDQEKLIPVNQTKVNKLNAFIKSMSNRKFSNHQEARRFHSAIKILMPKVVSIPIYGSIKKGWRCNLANIIHAGPNDCGVSEYGGEWIEETSIVGYKGKTIMDELDL